MTVQEYRDYIAAGNPVENGSEPHLFMHQMSQEAIRITMEINNNPSLMPLKISTVFWGVYEPNYLYFNIGILLRRMPLLIYG